jgi:hypothetical protein
MNKIQSSPNIASSVFGFEVESESRIYIDSRILSNRDVED